jgi:hypothetical protein
MKRTVFEWWKGKHVEDQKDTSPATVQAQAPNAKLLHARRCCGTSRCRSRGSEQCGPLGRPASPVTVLCCECERRAGLSLKAPRLQPRPPRQRRSL